MPPAPKPQKPVRGGVLARKHMDRVAGLVCVICRFPQVIVHHCICGRYSRSRASDFHTIPLCWRHHDAQSADGIHANKAAWVERHGEDTDYLDAVHEAIYGARK